MDAGGGPWGPRERALLMLLAQGHTDASAARELGLSQRSVSAMVRRLMDHFAVDNRFQLGVAIGMNEAALLGSHPEPDPDEPPLTA